MLEEQPVTCSTTARVNPPDSEDSSEPLVKVSGWTPVNGARYLETKSLQQSTPTREGDKPTHIRYTATNVPRVHALLFAGDIKNLHHDNLFSLAKHWTMTQIAEKVNAAHGEVVILQPALSNRLSRDIATMAKRDGKPREELVQELRNAQKANGVPVNGRYRSNDKKSPSLGKGGGSKRKRSASLDVSGDDLDRDGGPSLIQSASSNRA